MNIRLLPTYVRLFFLIVVVFFCHTADASAFSQNDYYLHEDFENFTFEYWNEYPSTTGPLCSNVWSIQNGVLIAKVTDYGCSTNLYPSDSLWKQIGSEYEVEFDMWLVSGIDHNFAMKFSPGYVPQGNMKANYYEYHFTSPGKISLGGGPPAALPLSDNPVAVTYNVPNKANPYKVRIVYTDNRVELYLDGHFIHKRDIDVGSSWNYLANERIAFRAGAGTSLSETHFDNLKVTSLNIPNPTPTPSPTPKPTMEVPYFSQIDRDWRDEQYDSSANTIGEVGCALTSIAMVMRYYGINEIPDAHGDYVALTPLTLNDWLVANSAFGKNTNVLFPSVSSLSKKLIADLNENGEELEFDAFEYGKLGYLTIDPQRIGLIERIIENKLHPMIFQENYQGRQGVSHFVVAKEVIKPEKEYGILDPVDADRTLMTIPPDELVSVRYLRPSRTDLSYLLFQSNEDVEMWVETPFGIVDKNASATESATLAFESPIGNPLSPDAELGNPIWEFDYQQPVSGDYLAYLKPGRDGFIEPWLFFYDEDGTIHEVKRRFFANMVRPLRLGITYDKYDAASTEVVKIVDWTDVKADLEALKRLGYFKNLGVYQSIKSIMTIIERFDGYNEAFADKMIGVLLDKIQKLSPKLIDPVAKEVLVDNLTFMMEQ